MCNSTFSSVLLWSLASVAGCGDDETTATPASTSMPASTAADSTAATLPADEGTTRDEGADSSSSTEGASTTSGDGSGSSTTGCLPQCEARECGPDGCGGICGRCGDDEACDPDGQCIAVQTVLFIFDQALDRIVRLEDVDGDGDMNDDGEITVFFDESVPSTGVGNAQGLVAEGPNLLWSTDNFDPPQVVRLEDLDRSGDALADGESTVFFSSPLPGDFSFDNPSALVRGPDGALYVSQNNGLDNDTIGGVFRLQDANDDGDADDPGEVTTVVQLAEAGAFGTTILDFEFGEDPFVYYVEEIGDAPPHIDRIDPTGPTVTTYVDGQTFFDQTSLIIADGTSAVEWLETSGELVVPVLDAGFGVHVVAIADNNDDGQITTAAEVRVLIDEEDFPEMIGAGSMNDLVVADDGTLFWVTGLSDSVWMARDTDRNGDYDAVTRIFEAAASAGDIAFDQPQTLSVYRSAG